MLKRLARLALVPLALVIASAPLLAPPSGAVTGKNIVPDFEHEYVGLVAFYDADGVFCRTLRRRGRRGKRRGFGAHLVRAGRRRRL